MLMHAWMLEYMHAFDNNVGFGGQPRSLEIAKELASMDRSWGSMAKSRVNPALKLMNYSN